MEREEIEQLQKLLIKLRKRRIEVLKRSDSGIESYPDDVVYEIDDYYKVVESCDNLLDALDCIVC